MTSFRAAPPSRSGVPRTPVAARAAALAELDRLWQRGPAGQLFLLVSASSAFVTIALVVALGLTALVSG